MFFENQIFQVVTGFDGIPAHHSLVRQYMFIFCSFFLFFFFQNSLLETYLLQLSTFFILHSPPTTWILERNLFSESFIFHKMIIIPSPLRVPISEKELRDMMYRPCTVELNGEFPAWDNIFKLTGSSIFHSLNPRAICLKT